MAKLASSLVKLRKQVDAAFPKRRKNNDGWIGDRAHANRVSDHNPDRNGIVHAIDITHDPANGVDCNKISAAIIASKDPRVKYLIWNRRIVSPSITPWKWRKYVGTNPHSMHMHVSVFTKNDEDTADWTIGLGVGKEPEQPPKVAGTILKKDSKGTLVRKLQSELNRVFPAYSKLAVDGDFGIKTEKVVRIFQRNAGIASDGIVGQQTLITLRRYGIVL